MRPKPPRFGAARVISKLGLGSRTQGAQWVREGRVRVNGRLINDPEFPVNQATDRISVDGEQESPPRLVIMLNKPRGLVTTTRDEQGRDTVYRCLEGAGLPWLAPVGRLDKASEGLLLFSNDPNGGADDESATGPDKTPRADRPYRGRRVGGKLARRSIDGELLSAKSPLLAAGAKECLIEIFDEGRNRRYAGCRRLDITIAAGEGDVGDLQLGDLPRAPGGPRKARSSRSRRLS